MYRKVNKSLVSTEELSNKYDVLELKAMIEDHVKYTNSIRGKEILNDFEEYLPKFKKIIPYDYKKMLNAIAKMEEKGLKSGTGHRLKHFTLQQIGGIAMGKPTGFLDYDREDAKAIFT